MTVNVPENRERLVPEPVDRGQLKHAIGLFVLISIIWGLTWVPIQIGSTRLPPLLFATTRGVAAGVILLLVTRLRGRSIDVARRDWPRVLAVGALCYTVTYALLFWGAARLDSGVTAVVNLTVLPVGLLVIGAVVGQARIGLRNAGAIGIGVLGLVLLNLDSLAVEGDAISLGTLAVAGSGLAYAGGTIVSKACIARCSPAVLAGWAQLLGAVMLLGLSAWLEDWRVGDLVALGEPAVLGSWLFLVVFGSIVAFTAYLRLLQVWPPHRAGMYAFVSPCVALLVGTLGRGEILGAIQGIGVALLLGAAVIALRPDRAVNGPSAGGA